MADVQWMQWTSKRTGELKAYAVDAETMEATGVARAINGAAIPEDAEPAKPRTPKDEFCLSILERRKEKAAAEKEKAKEARASSRGAKRTTKRTARKAGGGRRRVKEAAAA